MGWCSGAPIIAVKSAWEITNGYFGVHRSSSPTALFDAGSGRFTSSSIVVSDCENAIFMLGDKAVVSRLAGRGTATDSALSTPAHRPSQHVAVFSVHGTVVGRWKKPSLVRSAGNMKGGVPVLSTTCHLRRRRVAQHKQHYTADQAGKTRALRSSCLQVK